ncbi:MAG: sulfatase [Pirellulales bacterium]
MNRALQAGGLRSTERQVNSLTKRPLWTAFVALFTAVILSGAVQGATQSESKRPDVVFILSDDQAWNDYSFMEHETIRTPNIDQLARESLVFTRGYVPDSLCRPSLATIISGLYPHQHGIVGNDPPLPKQLVGKPRGQLVKNADYLKSLDDYLKFHIDRVDTLPDRLKKLGYRSFQSGKWWEGNPARGGFDSWMSHGDPTKGGRHGDEGLKIGREGMEPVRKFVKQAKEDGVPYFLWYAPMMPHTPHDPPAQLLEWYEKFAPTPSIAKYWAMCALFDDTIGGLREIINRDGRGKDTIIVYVTDNGWINLPDKSAYAPKSKRSQYDGGVRTPIMIHWPEHIAAQRDDQHLASSIDLVPTTLALLGVEKDDKLPGINLTNAAAVEGRRAVFGEILEHDIVDMVDPVPSLQYRWVVDGWDKLIVPFQRASDSVKSPIELYDLKADPWEEKNLAGLPESQAKIAALREKLDKWWTPAPSK